MSNTRMQDHESERLMALESYQLMNTPPDSDFDEITALAAQICGTPIALVTLLDAGHQWFKSHHGTELTGTVREIAFCSHTIQENQGVLCVSDARHDERFKSNPLVTGDTQIGFYAGVTLENPEGFALGTLCVIGHEPKQLDDFQLQGLKTLARQAMVLMELRRKTLMLETRNLDLHRTNAALQDFARNAVHDLKNPLTSISLNSQVLLMRMKTQVDERTLRLLERNVSSAQDLSDLINKLLQDCVPQESMSATQNNTL